MTRITFITVGKLKEKYLRDAVSEYAKRLTKYAKFEIIEVSDEASGEKTSLSEELIILKKEGERILKNIKDSGYVIATVVAGTHLDSAELAGKLAKLTVEGYSHIYFIIGGSLGLGAEVTNRADFLLSFSKMTFPHQLMRVILAEQVYRAFRINNNEPYHK